MIELGVPFTDPLADGKAIQDCNNVRSPRSLPYLPLHKRLEGTELVRGWLKQIALDQGVDYTRCLEFVKEARSQGLKTPVILMGKYRSPAATCSPRLDSTRR